MKEETGTLAGALERVLAEELGGREELPQETIEHLVRECLLDGAGMLKSTLTRRRKAMLKDHARCRHEFERRLRKRWKEPFELFESCLVIAQEMGSEFNANHRPAAATSNDLVFEVMTRLHGRACHLGSEVLHLMTGGYASGALTRWRALHEVVVVMLFIDLHGQACAERYLLHEHIEGAKAAEEYIKQCGPNGEITPEMQTECREIGDQLIARFGKSYGQDYGWAADYIPKGRRPSISELEKYVNLQRVRPYYRLASHATHANPKGVLFNLELGQRPNTILVGAADTGMADPGVHTLHHLILATSVLLGMHPDEETVMGSLALAELVDEGVRAFMEVHQTFDGQAPTE